MGEWRKRSPLLSRTTVIRVVNGSGSLIPATVKYSNGPSTTPIPAATDLYTLSGSYTRDAAASVMHQSSQKFLNRSGESSVYRTVCIVLVSFHSGFWSPALSDPCWRTGKEGCEAAAVR